MKPDFWLQRWNDQKIGFHEDKPNPLLLRYFERLNLPEGSHVFIPLCGKTLDISWFLSKGYRVTGVELSQLAIEQLFADLDQKPQINEIENFLHYQIPNLDIFVGDFFDLTSHELEVVDAIYDRAALVALPQKMRSQYAAHLTEVTDNAPQLLICLEYNQAQMEGPPFSIQQAEVERHYGQTYTLQKLESSSVPGGLKGQCEAMETAWLLKTT